MEILKHKAQEQTEVDKQQLIKIFAVSAIVDLLTTSGTIASFGLGVVIEEIIENFTSQLIAKYGKIELSKFDNTLGLLPIPGVTAVTVHCARKLIAIYTKEKLNDVKA